jgi:hypothetical protein
MKKLLTVLWIFALLTGCSQPPKPAVTEKPKPKEVELFSGVYAFHKMYIQARGWARDAQPFLLESQTNSDSTGKDGKSAIWRAAFASPLQHGVKPYTWSGTDAQDAPPRGVDPGTEDAYNPSNSSTQVFDPAFFKIDSDKALETAQKHGGEKILAQAADTPVAYRLDWNKSSNQLIWHVVYGPRANPKLRVAVDASSGDFIRVEK